MEITTHCSFVNVEVSIEESSIITLEVAELMPVATAGKAGLMSKDFFNIGKRRTLVLSGSRTYVERFFQHW